MAQIYEWDVEDVEVYEDGAVDVLDHAHQRSAAECIKFMRDHKPEGTRWDMVLVFDDFNYRQWAYVDRETMILPEYFENALGEQTRKVPQRFHLELAKSLTT